MNVVLNRCLLSGILLQFNFLYAQQDKPVIDFFHLGNLITFREKQFHLAWTSHPAVNFYKQEYIPKGEVINRFKNMIIIDLVIGNQNIRDVVAAKIAEIKALRESNPVVDYGLFESPKKGEYLIEFLLSQNSPDGKSVLIAERNIYRYKVYEDKSGNKGIMLFGVSTRSYGKDVARFFEQLKSKSERNLLIDAVSQFSMPAISLDH